MPKPPGKPGPEGPPKARPEARRPRLRTAKVIKPTMLETLLADPRAYGDNAIMVWVQAQLPEISLEFDARLDEHLEETGFFETYRELLQVSPGAPLAPGQLFLLFRASEPRSIGVYLCCVSPKQPEIVFEGVTFTTYHPMADCRGAAVGNPRPYQAAAKAVLKETGGKDWFGGIGEFASRWLQPPKTQKRVLN